MYIKSVLYKSIFLFLFFATPFSYAQNLNIFAEYGTNIYVGQHTTMASKQSTWFLLYKK